MTHPHTQGAAIEAAVNPSLELVEGGLQAAAAYDEADSESEDARIQAQYDNGTEYGDSGDDGEGYAEGQEEHEEGYVDSNGTFQLASNQVLLTLSYSLVSHVRQVARMEGVTAEDILLELIAEGVTKRAFQDFSRPTPSHFMTRTGYVPPEANGNVISQPTMSHHTMGNGQGQGRRNFNGNGNNRGGSPNGNYFPNRNGNGNGNGGGNRSFSGNGSYNGNGSGNYSGNGGGNRGNQNGGPQKNGNFRAGNQGGHQNGNQGGHQNGNQGGGQKNFKQNFQRNKNGNQGQQGGGNQSNQGNRGGQQNQHQGQGNQGQGNQSQGSHLHSDRANPNSSRDDE